MSWTPEWLKFDNSYFVEVKAKRDDELLVLETDDVLFMARPFFRLRCLVLCVVRSGLAAMVLHCLLFALTYSLPSVSVDAYVRRRQRNSGWKGDCVWHRAG